MSLQIVCPICHINNTVEDSTVGRYVQCSSCPNRFYVEAPTLADIEESKTGSSGINMSHNLKAIQQLISESDRKVSKTALILHNQVFLLRVVVVLQAAICLLLMLLVFWR
ncbi:MAG: hypothetical protein SGJ20_06285 [Planctomycetota bacterium]|nr:hypothetical protein [Planctomycetota bacterium]